MLDRVFICPRCGESGDDFELFSTFSECSDSGVYFHIYCGYCNEVIRSVQMDWEFCHRFLRRSFQTVETKSGVYHPGDWDPVNSDICFGSSQASAVRRQVLDCLDVTLCSSFKGQSVLQKSAARSEFDSLMRFILNTVVGLEVTLTLRDYLSWCLFKRMIWCFG